MGGISIRFFSVLCQKGEKYEGDVEGLGYVYWVPRYYDAPISGIPSQTSFNTPKNSRFTMTAYEMMIQKNNDSQGGNLQQLGELIKNAGNIISTYDAYLSFRSTSTTPITRGPEYIRINPQGTLVKNTNRITTVGKVASDIGKTTFYIAILIDITLVATGSQNLEEALINIAINTGIFILSGFIPEVGIPIGIAWFLLNLFKNNPRPILGSYSNIHGSITPGDKIKIIKPYIK